MPVMILPVTPMNASLGAHGSHVRYARNVIPFQGSYRPLPKQTLGSALTLQGQPVNGMHVHLYPSSLGTSSYTSDIATVFAGTQERLYSITASSSSHLSRAALYAQGGTDAPCAWCFCSFGNDVIATNYVDEIQYRANNAGSFANLITSAFKPQGRFVDVARTALIVANLEGSAAAGTGFADEYAWSVFGNAASFDTAGGAGRQRSLARPGQITGLVGGEFFRLFKVSSMSGVQFTGSSVSPWREDLISGSIGTYYGKSIVETKGGDLAFWGGDGFYRQSGMNPPQKMGPQMGPDIMEHVGYVFTRDLIPPLRAYSTPLRMLEEDAVMHGVRCARSGLVFWFYERPGSISYSDNAKKFAIVWDPESDIWSVALVSSEIAALASYPDRETISLVGGIVGVAWDGSASSKWFRFDSGETEDCLIRWGAQPIVLDGADKPVTVSIRGVMPLFSWRGGEAATPPDVEVTITAYDDPYLHTVTGGQPRVASTTVSSGASEWGWMNEPIDGSFFAPEVSFGSASDLIQSFRGLAIEYDAR